MGKSDDLINYGPENIATLLKQDITLPKLQHVTSLEAKKAYIPFCKRMCQRAWIDFDYLLNVALEGDYASYLKAMNDQFGINHRRIMEVTSESVKKYVDRGVFRDEDFAVQQYLNTVTNNLDAIYTFTNSKHFIYRSDCYDVIAMLDETESFDYISLFDSTPDLFLSFRLKDGYSRFYIKLCNVEESYVCQNGKESKTQNVSVLYFDGESTTLVMSFLLAKERWPFILMMPHGTALPCNSSTDSFDYCLTKANLETLVNPENGLHVTGCRCTEKKVCEERCYAWMFNPYKVMSIIGYVIDMYRNRHTLERKNSVRRAKCKRHEVSINNFYNKGEVISLQNLYKYERENKPWQGGHHASPVEHVRHAHERVYRNKDGSVKKVVHVGETVVSKGNKRDQAIEVKQPNNKMDLF